MPVRRIRTSRGLEIDYPSMMGDPASAISRLVEFLGRGRLPNEKVMTTVIDRSLYRRKGR